MVAPMVAPIIEATPPMNQPKRKPPARVRTAPPGLDEAELLCEEIALIRDGHLIARDTADGLREHFKVNRLEDVYVKAMAS